MFQLLTKQLEELGESYSQSKTVQIVLCQITDPDFENTKELCVENKCRIAECIERICAKERRISRGRMASKFKTLSIRRADVVDLKDSNNMEKIPERKRLLFCPT